MDNKKEYTNKEVWDRIISDSDLSQADNHGEIVIHTGFYYWNDGTIRDVPDPDLEDDRPVL